jgi:hypothetical protein
MLFPRGAARDKTRHRLWRRAGRLFLVMFLSNIVMLCLEYGLTGQLGRVLDVHWWLGLFTLETEYTISGILLPTCLFLVLSPSLFEIYATWKPITAIFGTLAGTVAIWSVRDVWGGSGAGGHSVNVLFQTGAGGFPIVPLVSDGALGFMLGKLWKGRTIKGSLGLLIAAIWTEVMLEWSLSLSPHLALTRLGVTLLGPLRFTVILLMAYSLTQGTMLNRGMGFLTVIGQYGLFAFLLHRVILHAMAFMNTHVLPLMRGELAYLGYMVARSA